MKDINLATIEGRIGRDTETATTSTGKQVTKFSIATGGKFKDKQTGQERGSDTEWHNIVFWGSFEARKGSRVHAEGKIQTNKYTDRNGVERSVIQIVCFDAPYEVS